LRRLPGHRLSERVFPNDLEVLVHATVRSNSRPWGSHGRLQGFDVLEGSSRRYETSEKLARCSARKTRQLLAITQSKGDFPMPNDQTALDAAMEQEPDLTSWGLAGPFLCTRNDIGRAKIVKDRDELRNSLEMFQVCCEFLRLCRRRKTINTTLGPSSLLIGYVRSWSRLPIIHGSFIAALIHMGVRIERMVGDHGVGMALATPLPWYPFQSLPIKESGRVLRTHREITWSGA
jgi:hypothetical protein